MNRHADLIRCLEGMADQDLTSTEVIVVDNAASAETESVVNAYARGLPIRYIPEPKVGLSQARRTGWRSAEGTIVSYIDDDAVIREGFAPSLIATFAHLDETVAGVGGPIRLVWPQGRPSWVSPWMENFYSGLNLGEHDRMLAQGESLWGCNMAFRRSFLMSVDAFSSPLGRTGTGLLSGEDWEIQRVAREMGLDLWYTPSVAVDHYVAPERTDPSWLRRRMFWESVSTAVLMRHRENLGVKQRLALVGDRIRGHEKRLVRGGFAALRGRGPEHPFLDIVVLSTIGFAYGMLRPAKVKEVSESP